MRVVIRTYLKGIEFNTPIISVNFKKKGIMKTTYKILIAHMIMLYFCSSCETKEMKKQRLTSNAWVLEFDSCEYVYISHPHKASRDVMAHKGNCRYCQYRK